jgi:hypothetical protein
MVPAAKLQQVQRRRAPIAPAALRVTVTDEPRPRSYAGAIKRFAAAALLTTALAGCGLTTEDLTLGLIKDDPEAPEQTAPDGVYVVQNGKRGRLDEDPKKVIKTWDLRTNLPPDVGFLIINDAIAAAPPDADTVLLEKVASVRNEIEPDRTTHKAPKAAWVVPHLPELKIPVTVARLSGSPRVLRVSATVPLEPGLYSLFYQTGQTRVGGRFGIQWNAVDKTQYAARYCVDRYLTDPVYYRPCSEGEFLQSAASAGLRVHDLKIRKDTIGGQPSLVLDGQLTNSSASGLKAPLLQAVVNDKAGNELQRWTFRPNAAQIPPGGTLRFSTSTVSPAGASGVTVRPIENPQAPSGIESQPLGDIVLPDDQLSGQ